jgi:hypothetical protein
MKYITHVFKSIFISKYRRLVVKHELSERYDDIKYNWKDVVKDYSCL